MEEPKKVIRCHYLGAESVSKPTGKIIILLKNFTCQETLAKIVLKKEFEMCYVNLYDTEYICKEKFLDQSVYPYRIYLLL